MKNIKLTIATMSSSASSLAIDKLIKKVKGVRTTNINFSLGKLNIECDDSTSLDAIKKAVTKAGYKVNAVD